ncbi:unnamed protein product, partial [Prorocentrum cordatum]
MRAYPTSAIGAVITFLAGFVAHDLPWPALVHEASDLPSRSGPGHELEASSTSSTSTSTSTVLVCSVLVTCSDDPGWTHERVLLWPHNEARTSWQIYTPGNDLYAEDFGDYASLIPMTGRRRYPPGVRNVVAFNRPLQTAELVSLIKRGRGEAVLEHGPPANGWWAGAGQDWLGGRMDIPAPTAVEVPRVRRRLRKKGVEDSNFGQMVPLSAAAILRGRYGLDRDEMGEWRLIEYVEDEQANSWQDDKLTAADRQRPPRSGLGDRLFGGGGGGTATPPAEPTAADVVAGPGEEQAEDLRTCWIDVDETGSRFKEWRKVVQESSQEVFSDSSLRGPPACLEVCRKMYRHGGTPKIWFQEWCKETGISRRDRADHEVQTLIERLYLAGTYGQVNMGALASLEVIARRLLQYTEAYSHSADHANWAAAKQLAGTTNPLDLVPEALRSYASRLSKEEHELEALRARAKTPTAPSAEGGRGAAAAALPPEWCEGLSAAQRRRWLRGGNAACESLSYLHGGIHRGGRAPVSSASQMKMDAISADAQQRVFSAARQWIDVDSAVSEEEAFARLLKGKAGYAPLGSTSMGSYEYSRVSLPDSVVDAPSLASMFPAQARQYLEELASRMLLPPREAALMRELDGLPGCHTDPLLLQRPRSYGKFVRRALSIGLVTLTRRPKSVLGLFFVKKKDGARLRFIVDCRRSNALFRPPPGVDLLSGEGLGRVEMPIMGDSDFAGLCAVLGVGDVADCFHRMKMQGDIRHYFCWPPLDAALTGKTLVEGRPVHAGEQVWPMSQSLPMGFSRSLYFAQAADQRRLDRQPSLAGSLRLSDRGPPLVLGQGAAGSEPGHYMCVDNAGVIGVDAARVASALQEAQRDFDGDHLKFHEVEVLPEGGRTLGCYLDGRRRATRPTDERFAMVRKGLRCLLRRRKVAGWQLEMVLGHMTFMALVRREVLSIFHSVYAFVAQSYHAFSVLWPTVRDELNCYLGIMVMLESSWTRQWAPVVYSSDASLCGYGVAEACFGAEAVAEVGRVSELARWRLGAGLARQHAFECAGFLLDSETGEVVRDEAGAPKRLDAELQRVLASERWELDPSFPEVPSWLLHDSHWATVMADRWAFADDILRLEARALVKAAARAAHCQPVKECRSLLLGDNLAVVLCFCRFRSRDFRLLIQVCRFAALCLAREIKFVVRWIPSEFNSGDEGSRRFDPAYDAQKSFVTHLGSNSLSPQVPASPVDAPAAGARGRREQSAADAEPTCGADASRPARDGPEVDSDAGQPWPPTGRPRSVDQSRGLAARLVLEGATRPPRQSSVAACLRLSPGEPRLADKAVAGHGVAEVAAESESVVSSDAEGPPAAARSRRRLEPRGKAQLRKAIGALETAESGRDDVKLSVGYPGKRSVGTGTLETYRQCVLAFCAWARCCLAALPELMGLDGQLVECMSEKSLTGVEGWRGGKLLGGLMFFHPDFGRLGGLHLPRSLRCLGRWEELSPSRSRKPLVSAIWSALAVDPCHLGAPLVGAMVLIMMLSLTSGPFLAPTEHAVQIWIVWLFPRAWVALSKVGSADDTIPCESGRLPWTCHIFKALKDRQPSQPLLDLSYPQYSTLFRRAATHIGAD